ncbi:hypothetical protein ACFOTA_21045 [Chitinophaga sp. GCM10012297]|uniref:Uncharacterized protein n=1 Tax=Chitinophaga chungangae TaxID=2821488 RepID=A0ABS3YJ88_9BACT|nr:hypothetical protein [Chitinophaga chungangae]MBO9154714.1 hypothetical protein [Chitinophaga chungangae]
MRHFQASAVERRKHFTGTVSSHPMEAGWAGEAIFFLIVEELTGKNASVNAYVEISPDGINWIPEGAVFPVIDKPGYYFCKVSHFGNWLRINGVITDGAEIKASVHLHLKS